MVILGFIEIIYNLVSFVFTTMEIKRPEYLFDFKSLVAIPILILIGLFFTSNILSFDLDRLPGNLGDMRFNLYILEHNHLFFTGQLSTSYWDAPFMYPVKNIITFSDNLIGSAPLYSLPRIIGFRAETSFQIWYILVTSLNFVCCFVFLKKIFENNSGALVGAFIFAFSLALQSQLTHAQTFPRFAIPLAFMWAHEFKNKQTIKSFFMMTLSIVYQFYCGIYLGFFLSILMFFFLATSLIIERKKLVREIKKPNWVLKIIGSLLINVGLLLILMYPYYLRSKEVPPNDYTNIFHSIPHFKSYFFSQRGSLLWDSLSSVGIKNIAFWDHQIFTGSLCLIALLYCIVSLIIKQVKNLKKNTQNSFSLAHYIIAFSLTIIFFTRTESKSLYYFIYQLPGFSSMRSITRIINVELIFLSFFVCYLFTTVQSTLKENQKKMFFGTVLILAIIDNHFSSEACYTIQKDDVERRVDKLANKLTSIPPNTIISYEPDFLKEAAIFYQLDAMLASQKKSLTCVNGYTATSPGEFTPFWNHPNETNRKAWLDNRSLEMSKIIVIK